MANPISLSFVPHPPFLFFSSTWALYPSYLLLLADWLADWLAGWLLTNTFYTPIPNPTHPPPLSSLPPSLHPASVSSSDTLYIKHASDTRPHAVLLRSPLISVNLWMIDEWINEQLFFYLWLLSAQSCTMQTAAEIQKQRHIAEAVCSPTLKETLCAETPKAAPADATK